MKLIIDIPEEIYQEALESGYSYMYDEVVANAVAEGIPLDDVKAEIKTFTITEKSEYDIGFNDAALKCFNILDNIGKEREEKVNGKNE